MKRSLSTSTLLAAAATTALIFAEDQSGLLGSYLGSGRPSDEGSAASGMPVDFGDNCGAEPFRLSEGSRRLALTRLKNCERSLEEFVRKQARACSQNPQSADEWRLLAEAYLERSRARTSHKGLRVGEPVLDALPPAMAAEIESGLNAVKRAQALHGEDADLLRIEAELLSAQITGFTSAIKVSGKISELTRKALILDRGHPRLQVTLGARKLFAPEFLGHDPRAARAHLLAAAAALKLDERPLLLAAMASYLLGEIHEAAALLERAAERNPANRFIAAVVRRLEAGEDDPFERDLPSISAMAAR